jgi:hypothetical protein
MRYARAGFFLHKSDLYGYVTWGLAKKKCHFASWSLYLKAFATNIL